MTAANNKSEGFRLPILPGLVGEDAFFASGDELLNSFHQKTGGNTAT